jgi:hypothetical protein
MGFAESDGKLQRLSSWRDLASFGKFPRELEKIPVASRDFANYPCYSVGDESFGVTLRIARPDSAIQCHVDSRGRALRDEARLLLRETL